MKGIAYPITTYRVIGLCDKENAPEDPIAEEREGFQLRIDPSLISPEDAQHGLDELAQLLALADTVIAACRVEQDGVSVLVHVATE